MAGAHDTDTAEARSRRVALGAHALRAAAFSTLAVLALSCAAARGGADGAAETGASILVVAAADLRFAFAEIEPLFERQCGCRVDISYGSSGQFATQIEQGLPADVFFSADAGFVDALEARGLTLAGTKQAYAVGRIVLAKSRAVGAKVETLQDLLGPDVRRVAIANPRHAPYGVAAQEALTRAGVWQAVQARLVLGENASQATQFIETGDAQAGIVPLSLAAPLAGKLSYVLVDPSLYSPLRQSAAVLKRSSEPETARAFIAFVIGAAGREVMARYGFLPPD